MRFLADMGVSPRCAQWLRAQGHDAVHLYEQDLHALPDNEVMRKAWEEKRVLLTMDLDFAQLASTGMDALPTVVVFRLNDQRPQSIQRRLEELIPTLESMQGKSIVSVSNDRIRIRKLPIR
jgi:predicted nuclease of predicted toxin-antitoxin system